MTRELATGEVPGAFDDASAGYDLLVGLNPGYHRALRRSARALRLPAAGARVLDLGCGTGASTAALLSVAPDADIVAVDASAGMLARARAKPWPRNVSFVHSRAEDLAEAGVEGPFDAVFAAYLVRNLPDPDPTLRAVRGLLRPGGRVVVHEYSVADSPVRAAIWTAVCWSVVIPSGWLVTRDRSLYTYLWRSVLRFDGVGALRDRLRRNGFNGVRSETATGWQRGIVHTFVGCAGEGTTDGGS
ncbi:ubiquinone/menaquinone biosynthesis C-methylase UbiE [Saccharothrix tamanrassetensis]|uniref:Ubiquinone/menaquinone biosynthesis C-methylase UbiE n=1 Tax=Saccharothrix tamanrassetensis TaxID=1051531 RepID=A0A841CIB6_9PSEU|nr:class I SAM-dependent methyltransferase [Saccharothrix tamanrassetensis]MBB5957039.1 ubiquinone/menaquinone biosynthesis C-methylase UbiE [Saccharothrix tamanrassetensis]